MLGDVSDDGSMSVVLSVLLDVDADVLLLRCAVDSGFLGILVQRQGSMDHLPRVTTLGCAR